MRTENQLVRPATSDCPRVTWQRIAVTVGTLGLLLLAAPWVWKAVSAGLGRAALVLLVLVGAAAVQALLLAAQKLDIPDVRASYGLNSFGTMAESTVAACACAAEATQAR
jgi:hypothetical protein